MPASDVHFGRGDEFSPVTLSGCKATVVANGDKTNGVITAEAIVVDHQYPEHNVVFFHHRDVKPARPLRARIKTYMDTGCNNKPFFWYFYMYQSVCSLSVYLSICLKCLSVAADTSWPFVITQITDSCSLL